MITERGLIKTARVIAADLVIAVLPRGIDLPAGNVIGSAFRTHPAERPLTLPFYTDTFAQLVRQDGGYTIALSGTGRLEPGFEGLTLCLSFSPYTKPAGMKSGNQNPALLVLQGPESGQAGLWMAFHPSRNFGCWILGFLTASLRRGWRR
ncbi:hypothetical protein WDV93_13750 [Pantoea ananatis]